MSRLYDVKQHVIVLKVSSECFGEGGGSRLIQTHNLKVAGSNPAPATTPSGARRRAFATRGRAAGQSRWDAGPISGQLQRQGAVGGKDRPYDEKSDSTPIDPTIHPIPCVWSLAQHRQVVSRTVADASRRLSDARLGDYRGAASSRFPAFRGTGQTGANRRSWRRPKERSSGASSESAPRATASRIVAANPVYLIRGSRRSRPCGARRMPGRRA